MASLLTPAIVDAVDLRTEVAFALNLLRTTVSENAGADERSFAAATIEAALADPGAMILALGMIASSLTGAVAEQRGVTPECVIDDLEAHMLKLLDDEDGS